jgi:hypothetical protein
MPARTDPLPRLRTLCLALPDASNGYRLVAPKRLVAALDAAP